MKNLTKNEIRQIRIEYKDNRSLTIEAYEIEKLEKAEEAIALIERATRLFRILKAVFK